MSKLKSLHDRSRASILELAMRGLTAALGARPSDTAPLLADACPMTWVTAGEVIRWRDDCPGPKLIVRGWACESWTLSNGRRQVFDFLLPGDICFPQVSHPSGRFEVRALTTTQLLCMGPALRQPGAAGLGALLRRAHDLNLERRYDAAVRLGQLTAEERTLDLLKEFHERLGALDLVKDGGYRLPLSQAQLADALGLSAAHLNRTLAALSRRALVEIRSGVVRLSSGANCNHSRAT